MRTLPWLVITPADGFSNPERTLRSVVFPQPEGPTMATNSPAEISKLSSFRTSSSPKAFPTRSNPNALSLISPTHTGDPGQAHQSTIDRHAGQTDHDHLHHQDVSAQAVARIHHREPQTVASGDHLGGHHHQPADSG